MNGPLPRLLYLDVKWPRPELDAASLRASQLLAALRRLGYAVDVGVTDPTEPIDRAALPDARPLEAVGEDALLRHVALHGAEYQVAVVAWTRLGQRFVGPIRAASLDTVVAFDTVDVNHIREYRHAKVTGNVNLLRRAMAMKSSELETVRKADRTVAVTEADADVLRHGAPGATVDVIGMAVEPRMSPVPGPAERRGMLFLGNVFAWHNVDAILHLAKDLLPPIRRVRPQLDLTIVGAGYAEPLDTLNEDPAVIRLGAVADLQPVFDRARMFACPLRIGSGIKGKLLSALALGLPVVTTSIGAEGMGLEDGVDVLIADSTEAFSAAVVRLDTDDVLWRRLSEGGQSIARHRYSLEVMRRQVEQVFAPPLGGLRGDLVATSVAREPGG